MKILVAGGLGMIGSNVVRILLRQGHSVWTADLADDEDLRSAAQCQRAVAKADAVFHLADKTVGIGYSSQHHGDMLTDSLLISLNLLKAAKDAGVKKYLYVSSSCVYPDGISGRVCESEDAGWPEAANEGYGWAKRVAEYQCQYFARQYGMHVVIARPANVFGPNYDWKRPVDDMHAIPALICRMVRRDPEIKVWGTGYQTRTFQYEADAAELIVALAEAGESGEAYNLGGHEVSLHEVAERLKEITGWPGEIIFDRDKPEGPKRKAQNISKITKLFHKMPLNTPLVEGLAATCVLAHDKVIA